MFTARTLFPALALCALPAFAAAPNTLTYLPADAVAAGRLNLSDLRRDPLTRDLWTQMDDSATDGDGAAFLNDAGLRIDDFDALTFGFAPAPSKPGDDRVIMVVEGRFDPARLGAALLARGATREANWYRLPDKDNDTDNHRGTGALAIVSDRLLLIGDEPSVSAALAGPAPAGALSGKIARVSAGASGWMVIDAARLVKSEANDDTPRGGDAKFAGLIRSAGFFTGEFTLQGDRLAFTARLESSDAQARADLEDLIRGAFAAWRMAAQEKMPEMVEVIRGFGVKRDSAGVTVDGVLPGKALRQLRDKARERHAVEAKATTGGGSATGTAAAAR